MATLNRQWVRGYNLTLWVLKSSDHRIFENWSLIRRLGPPAEGMYTLHVWDVQNLTWVTHTKGTDVIGGYCTEYVRIGEDYDDVEYRAAGSCTNSYLSVDREIVCDV